MTNTFSLNPFSFRAGVLPYQSPTCWQVAGLNPFSFRAGVLHLPAADSEKDGLSQSLFIQGWGTT